MEFESSGLGKASRRGCACVVIDGEPGDDKCKIPPDIMNARVEHDRVRRKDQKSRYKYDRRVKQGVPRDVQLCGGRLEMRLNLRSSCP
jgi:hypothetical protein